MTDHDLEIASMLLEIERRFKLTLPDVNWVETKLYKVWEFGIGAGVDKRSEKDYDAGYDDGKEEGISEGYEDGIVEARKVLARNNCPEEYLELLDDL